MIITGADTFPVVTPAPHRGGPGFFFVRLDTDNGLHGYGEVMLDGIRGLGFGQIKKLIENLIERFVIGHDPRNIELLWERLYARAGYSHYPGHTRLAFLSGLEMACWDLIGKHWGKPAYQLFGGQVRPSARTYTYLYAGDGDGPRNVWQTPDYAAQRARAYVNQGFTAVKLDPFSEVFESDARALDLSISQGQKIPVQYSLDQLDTAERVVRAIREEVGSACDILIGTHGQMTASSAIRTARRLEPYDPLWFEEVVPPENMAEMAKVAKGTSIPITTGERLTTKYEFARLIEHDAAAIFNFDIGQVGGLWEGRKIAMMAEAHYLQVAPHVYGGPLIAAASLQLALASPNFLIMETIERMDGFHSQLVEPAFDWHDGHLWPSGLPGLGHELREQVARANAAGVDE
jgi:galactonate dehydratase